MFSMDTRTSVKPETNTGNHEPKLKRHIGLPFNHRNSDFLLFNQLF